MKEILLGLLVSVMFVGCAALTVDWTPYPGYVQLEATQIVEVLDSKPDKPFITLGSIDTEGYGKSTALNKAVLKAKSVGADALVIKKEAVSENTGMNMLYTTAIKYK